MKISILYLGRIECRKNCLIQCGNSEEMIKSPISAILIQHPILGNVLYDTGNSPFYSSEYSEFTLKTYPIPEYISIEEALNKKGCLPSDIDMIILSHLHFDHVGGLKYFRGTKAFQNVIVAESELKNAYCEVMTGKESAYIKSLFDLEGIQYKTISGDTELAEDVKLFVQNSHTPGVTGMLLKSKEKGNIIVTGDTIYTRENYEKEIPPGGSINKTEKEFFDNLARIRQMEKGHSAMLLYGHDYDQIIRLSQEESFE